jgi:dihydroxyacetone kinase-like protein
MTDAVTLAGLSAWVRGLAALIAENKEQLTALDAAIGDADHGINMDRGMTAVLAALDGDDAPSSAAGCSRRSA